MNEPVLVKSDLPGLKHVGSGKVRDMFDLGDELLIVTTDRLSAFDVVMASGIPFKGKVLNRLSEFWFGFLGVPHHMITCDIEKMPPEVRDDLVLQFLIENTRDIRLIRKSNQAMRSRITFNLSAGIVVFVILVVHFVSTGWLASLWQDIIR